MMYFVCIYVIKAFLSVNFGVLVIITPPLPSFDTQMNKCRTTHILKWERILNSAFFKN